MSHSSTPPVRNRAPLTAQSSSYGEYRQPSTTLQNITPKLSRQNPESISQRIDLSWNARLDFLKIPSLCEAVLETEQRCFSKVIPESNVTPNITSSSDSFSTVPPIIDGGDWGTIVDWANLETIIVLVLLAFKFITQMSHHSLTLIRLWIRDSATVTNAWG